MGQSLKVAVPEGAAGSPFLRAQFCGEQSTWPVVVCWLFSCLSHVVFICFVVVGVGACLGLGGRVLRTNTVGFTFQHHVGVRCLGGGACASGLLIVGGLEWCGVCVVGCL